MRPDSSAGHLLLLVAKIMDTYSWPGNDIKSGEVSSILTTVIVLDLVIQNCPCPDQSPFLFDQFNHVSGAWHDWCFQRPKVRHKTYSSPFSSRDATWNFFSWWVLDCLSVPNWIHNVRANRLCSAKNDVNNLCIHLQNIFSSRVRMVSGWSLPMSSRDSAECVGHNSRGMTPIMKAKWSILVKHGQQSVVKEIGGIRNCFIF